MVEEKLREVVDEMVAGLSDGERRKFEKKVENCLYSRRWCSVHGIDYSDPDVMLARAELYQELYMSKSRVLL